MKVVILAGGLGTRLSEETELKPKPMVEIGGKPILWHIMKIFSSYDFNDFIICCGYKGWMIKHFFANYFLYQADLTVNLGSNQVEVHRSQAEPWNITMVDTGQHTMTGGRLKRIQAYIGNETFLMTYGDGLSDINIPELIDFHKRSHKIATVSAVQTSGRFGALGLRNNDTVASFNEKPTGDGSWINGGFFVLEPAVFDFIRNGDKTIWEREPLEELVKNNQLSAYRHFGSWKSMDTLRDKIELENIWESSQCFWKSWKD
jgi:glucose-1-phosphate cytidylyltransferase